MLLNFLKVSTSDGRMVYGACCVIAAPLAQVQLVTFVACHSPSVARLTSCQLSSLDSLKKKNNAPKLPLKKQELNSTSLVYGSLRLYKTRRCFELKANDSR